MKKAMTLCAAALLTVSTTATAYAAPFSCPTLGKVIVCDQDTMKEAFKNSLREQLASCFPSFSGKLDINICKPNTGSGKPNTGTSKPNEDTSKPNEDTTKPDTKPSKPSEDTSKPDTTPSKPSEDTSKPDTDPSKPNEDTSKPDTKPSDTETQSVSAYAKRVVQLVNQERAKVGLPALTLDTTASKAAQVRAKEIRTSFSHTRPNGNSCFTALKEAGVSYRTAGENIAAGQQTPEQVVAAWMNSEGHRKNILGSQYTAIGVGYLEGGYWTQFFIG